MKTFPFKTDFFDDFFICAKKAKITAAVKESVKSVVAEYSFNGIQCRVNSTTDVELLFRDYLNAHHMGWNYVGPNCRPSYRRTVRIQLA